jgi:hypothetical protein
MINNNRKGLEMNILNKVYVGDLNEVNNEYYGNVEDVKCKFNKDGYYKFNCLSDSVIEIDSIEYIGLDNKDEFEEVIENVIGIKDGKEYINISIGNVNIEMIFKDNVMDENCNDLNMEIVRRKDNNKIFKLCYDLGDSLCEVYELVDGEYVDSDSEEVYE